MGTALVMEHANALAQMIVSEKDKLFDERVEALVKLYRRAEFYLKQIHMLMAVYSPVLCIRMGIDRKLTDYSQITHRLSLYNV